VQCGKATKKEQRQNRRSGLAQVEGERTQTNHLDTKLPGISLQNRQKGGAKAKKERSAAGIRGFPPISGVAIRHG
jgi:hypothetical protein